MKKLVVLGAVAAMALPGVAIAQNVGATTSTKTTTTVPTENGQGADVLRETDRTLPAPPSGPMTEPALPDTTTTQTVTTPSGNVNSTTRTTDGEASHSTTTDHYKSKEKKKDKSDDQSAR